MAFLRLTMLTFIIKIKTPFATVYCRSRELHIAYKLLVSLLCTSLLPTELFVTNSVITLITRSPLFA
jgi:hypothetical protein